MECEIVHYEDGLSLFYFIINQQPSLRPNHKEKNRYKFLMNNPRKSIYIYYFCNQKDILENKISPMFYNQRKAREWFINNNNKSNYGKLKLKGALRDDLWKGSR